MTTPEHASPRMRHIEDFTALVRELVREYMQTLSANAPLDIHHVRLEATGAGVGVIYSENGPDAVPTMQVSLQSLPTTEGGGR